MKTMKPCVGDYFLFSENEREISIAKIIHTPEGFNGLRCLVFTLSKKINTITATPNDYSRFIGIGGILWEPKDIPKKRLNRPLSAEEVKEIIKKEFLPFTDNLSIKDFFNSPYE